MVISAALAWFLTGIALFLIELALPGFIIFFFGIGAWSVTLATLLTHLSLQTQLLLFLGSSLVTLLTLRRLLRTVFLGRSRKEGDSVTMVPQSATATVTQDIVPPKEGQVKFGGSFWRARSDQHLPQGTVVRILAQKDLLVTVEPVTHPQEEIACS